ncbi:chemotaxis protein CheW [Methanospirillum hungatei]|uniref:chemotaxis protein CheW n=2 Tax=Methanospirillum hungatei TaxID=2203 RepID=UPI0009D469D6|nr:chemotaxis protein CheW [Methanospirillum hungatei]OQA54576.1 MAG: purine-binding chemotaxis protein [Euryarchaeota archaeon ADurb.Bin294]HOW05942.1 chemotaxis protein CheW [Methanospirillum hungatei]
MAGIIPGIASSPSPGVNGLSPHKMTGKVDEEGAEESFQVVEFLLGEEHFAIDLFDVKEVVEYTRITKLPNSPTYIKGIIDLRGEITTIIDLKQQLAITSSHAASEEEKRIIVLDDRITHSKIGIMVDDVLTVSTYSASHVDETATSGEESSHILGIIKKKIKDKDKERTELVIWLDVKTLLRDMGQIK